MTTEIEAEAVLRNVVATVASTLRPGAMLAFPLLSAPLLPGALPLPAALLQPSPLLLPRDCLLLATARLLLLSILMNTLSLPLGLILPDLLLRLLLLRLLPGSLNTLRLLLLSRLLGTLILLLLRPRLLSLPYLLRLLSSRLLPGSLDILSLLLRLGAARLLLLPGLLRTLFRLLLLRALLLGLLDALRRLLFASLVTLGLSLRTLLPCGRRRGLLLPVLLLCRVALFFVLLLVLRVRRDERSDKQKQSSGPESSIELHVNVLPWSRYQPCTQTAGATQ